MNWLFVSAVSGFVAVALGAFGAHGLRERLGADMMTVYETGVTYHFYHTLALLAVAVLVRQAPAVPVPALQVAGWCFLGGILVFSGSLYTLSLTGVRWLGAITPLGGALFLVGWAALAWAALRGAHA